MSALAKPRLGKGLEALFNPSILSEPPVGDSGARVPIEQVKANPHQPRKHFDEDELVQLAESIRTHGLLQPVAVRRTADGYQLIAGERRHRACQLAGLTEIPVHVLELNDQQVFEAALVENVQRTDLNPIEKAQSFREYLQKFHMTQDQLAAKIGVDRSTISNLLGVLNLQPEVQEFVRLGQLSTGHAKVLKGITEPERQIGLAKEVIAKQLSVHALEQVAKDARQETASAKSPRTPGPEKTNHVEAIENELRQKLAVRVGIKMKAKEKGQIVFSFDSNDDFERIVDQMRK